MKELVIDRNKWARVQIGQHQLHGKSRLVNEENCMCCLGFDMINNGAKPDDIRDKCNPSEVSVFACSLPELDWRHAIRVNDRSVDTQFFACSDKQQEKAIIEVFQRNGVLVKFIN